jgi:hypothetical protein
MAKLFYTLDEAAEKLGKSPEEVKELIQSGQLQEFRDRDKIMLKVDQVNILAGDGGDETGVPLSPDSGGSSVISLASDSGSAMGIDSPKEQSGISVFEADELEDTDPSAQTQITETGTTDFAMDPSGSGSGLLDLTREVDDTSLGEDLMEDVYSGGPEGERGELFESTGDETAAPGAAPTVMAVAAEPYDPVGSGWVGGLALFSVLVLAGAMTVVIGAMTGGFSDMLNWLGGNMMMALVGAAVLLLICALVGFAFGKMAR